jgi:hypothetical protein
MLDKGQIKDWDGEPEKEDPKADAAKPSIAAMVFAPREALPTGERVTLTPEQVSARRKRSQWLAIALFVFVILVFVLTMSKVGGGIPERL